MYAYNLNDMPNKELSKYETLKQCIATHNKEIDKITKLLGSKEAANFSDRKIKNLTSTRGQLQRRINSSGCLLAYFKPNKKK